MATRSGVLGLPLARHAQEELSTALVHAPIPVQQTEEETAVDLDELKNQGDVTDKGAQVMTFYYDYSIFKLFCSFCHAFFVNDERISIVRPCLRLLFSRKKFKPELKASPFAFFSS